MKILIGFITFLTSLMLILPIFANGMDNEKTEIEISKNYHKNFVIDDDLMEIMESLGKNDKIEIIVQFTDKITNSDRKLIERLGMETIDELNMIPALLIAGTHESIIELSKNMGIFWIEENENLELALDLSTKVINATRVWEKVIKDSDQTQRTFPENPQSYSGGIDGTGVTIAVVDTGVDAGHPDLDYKEKTLINLWSDGPSGWVERENCDTSYGHGTHCAGIAAGNGDASAGARRGVAPGANLIGVGGDWTPVAWNVVEGMEWVYENSKPGNNPYNIRVVSNSWGGAGDYEPESVVTQVSNKLMYENNVVVVFAGMNSGDGNHDGHEDTTSSQSKIPSVISVAAAERDASGIAGFSSRGESGRNYTYPDITAPGVNIWATAPRGTWLDTVQRQDGDFYYMAISGTSMATPHVSGAVALLFQAAPSLTVSNVIDDYSGNDTTWWSNPEHRIHETELIFKLTSDVIPSSNNGVPESNETGTMDRYNDFAQGYGMINMDRAVELALILETLRTSDLDKDGKPDWVDANVFDAFKILNELGFDDFISGKTDTLITWYRGEWAQLTDQEYPGLPPINPPAFSTDQDRNVFIPTEAKNILISLKYEPSNTNTLTGGSLELSIDMNDDGLNDLLPQLFDNDGEKIYELDISTNSDKGKLWIFNVYGEGWRVADPEYEWFEALIEYSVEIEILLDLSLGSDIEIKYEQWESSNAEIHFGEPSNNYDSTTEIRLFKTGYDIGNYWKSKSSTSDDDENILFILGLIAIIGVIGIVYFQKDRILKIMKRT